MAAVRTLALLALLAAPSRLPAQDTPDPGPLAAVERLFDAMRRRDTAALRAAFDSSARLVGTSGRDGVATLRVIPVDRWIEAVGRATAELDERIWDPVVQTDGPLATVWVKYELLVDGRFSHCGVDAFQLFRGPGGWKIFQVADTQRRDNCWHKP